ncbi:MAG: efflux RND transporter permease subunit [Aliidiomarina sp.]|uniref:efflux RND transporter permease subunit n=1 Tax=Aliidiomarina sp. TaxID=1872439 RepID=UPI0025B98138|nr:efflux RND transporter permease subunit [Aliidiomarina sp.]MCH8501947.1 efflux RND transporter permease subunit [Aliidiomarina sp.]
MRGLSSQAIRRPIGTLSLTAVILVLGLFFVQRLPVDLLPHIEYPQITVTVNHPGVAPEVMEEQVTRVLERNLAAVENLVLIDSRASEGRTNVNLHFELGTNLDLALQDAGRLLELARTQLPPDAEPPRLYKRDPSQDPVWQAGFSSTVRSEVAVRDWVVNQLTPQLVSIHGVAGVEVAGGLQREMEVIVDQQRLRAFGLRMQDIVDLLAMENIDVAAGWMTSASFDVMAKTDGMLTSEEDVANLLLQIPGSDQRIRLSEVAEVRDGFREQRLFSRLNGTPAVQVSLTKLPEANTVDVVEAVQSLMLQLDRSGFLPADIRFQPIDDPVYFIRGAISSVGTAAVLGGVLAMLMVMLFLGSLRKSFVVGLSIPVAVLATFALMGASGLTLNVISLGGLALGVGLLLDNAIVMLENIFRHQKDESQSIDESAEQGAAEVSSAITAGTLTNLAAVLPFLLITGYASMIFRELILTISFAILATLAAALTLIPALAALLAKISWQSGFENSWLVRGFARFIGWLQTIYVKALAKLLRWRYMVVAAAIAGVVVIVNVGSDLGNEFLPQVDDGGVSVRLVLPSGTPPLETDEAARQIEAVIMDMPHVETMFALVGGHLGGGIINERPGTSNIRVQLTPSRERPDMTAGQWVAEAQQRLDALDLPGARISVRPPSIRGLQFSPGGADFSISVVGDELRDLRETAREIAALLQGIPGLEGVEVGREDQSPLMRIIVDRERAADLGLRVSEIGRAVRFAVDGAVPSYFRDGQYEYDVRVRLPRDQVNDEEVLGNLLLDRVQGAPVLLRDVASFQLGEGPAHIERENQNRVVRINGDINTAVNDVASIMAEVDARMEGFELPESFSLIYAGQWETIQETNRELRTVVFLALFLVFVVMAVQYERLTNPLVILTAAPLALVGVVSILKLTSTALSAPVLIGVVLLIGIVVNNAILLVEYIEKGRRDEQLSMHEAVLQAASVRLRPILMTTLTTVLGMLPLALGIGEGAEIMHPLALTVVGGLLSAMLLTLFVVPAFYLIVNGVAERLVAFLTSKRGNTA